MNRSRSRSPASSRRLRVSYEQMESLIEYLEQNRELATGYFNSTAGRRKATKHWEQVALNLNAIGGGTLKDAKGWSAYWSDFKNKLKKKKRLMQLAIGGTGGGRPKAQNLSELDLRALRVLGQTFGEALPGVRVDPHLETEAEYEEQTGAGFVFQLDGVFSDDFTQTASPSLLGNQNEGGSYLYVSPTTENQVTVVQPVATAMHVESPPPRIAVVAPPQVPQPSPLLHSARTATASRPAPRTRRRRRCSPLPSALDRARAAVTEIERSRLEQERQQVRNAADTAAATTRLAAAVEAMAASQREQTEAVRAAAGAMQAAATAIQAVASAFRRAVDVYEISNMLPVDASS